MSKKRIYTIITVLLILLTTISTLESFYSIPQAGTVCSQMGSFMARNSIKRDGIIKSNEPNRKWTVEEVFSNSTKFTSYYGEGEGDWTYANKVDRGAARASLNGYDWSDATVQDNIKSLRNFGCFFSMGDGFPNLGLNIASSIAGLISTVVGFLIGQDFMVESLVEIIGGVGGSDGLISIFFRSIYMPLVVLAFLFTAMTIIYKGLIKRQLREALSSIIWSTLAFVVGVTLMFIPSFLVGIPQAVTSTITTCVLGAINGENCLTGDVTTPSLLTGIECSSRIEGDSNSADMMVNGMSCTIWKTFVLEPWAEEQFGAPYSELYTADVPAGGSLWNGLSGEDRQYCVNLASSQSADSIGHSGTIDMNRSDNSTVCNIAVYQLYLMTEMEDSKNHSGDEYKLTTSFDKSTDPYDERWYDIILPMAKHNTGWKNWNGQSRLLSRIATANMSILAVSAAALVLIVLSVFGAAYKVIGVIMMAFAPLFLLFAVEPGRGRKIFLGWLETLISSMLKYFAITILIIVSLVLYAGVLSTTSGVVSFVSVIVLTVALLNYRSEVVDLIGASNMGGQKLSNKANKALDWTKKQGKEKGSALVGGAIGGSLAASKSRKEDINKRDESIKELQDSINRATAENRVEDVKLLTETRDKEQAVRNKMESAGGKIASQFEGVTQGAGKSMGRVMRRGTSLTANAFKQKSMTENELEKKYADSRGKAGIGNDKRTSEIKDAMTGDSNQKTDNKNNPNMNNNDFKDETKEERTSVNDLDLNKTTLDEQRDKLEYIGDLTDEERAELDKFADAISRKDDAELMAEANDSKLMTPENENKRMAVTNEINARLRFNTLTDVVSNPALAMSAMANPVNMTPIDLELAMNISGENYQRSGEETEIERFRELSQERVSRNIMTESELNKKELYLKQSRQVMEDSNSEFIKNEEIKTDKELQDMYDNDRDGYNKYINESKLSNEIASAIISQELINRQKEVVNLRDNSLNEQKLPNLDETKTTNTVESDVIITPTIKAEQFTGVNEQISQSDDRNNAVNLTGLEEEQINNKEHIIKEQPVKDTEKTTAIPTPSSTQETVLNKQVSEVIEKDVVSSKISSQDLVNNNRSTTNVGEPSQQEDQIINNETSSKNENKQVNNSKTEQAIEVNQGNIKNNFQKENTQTVENRDENKGQQRQPNVQPETQTKTTQQVNSEQARENFDNQSTQKAQASPDNFKQRINKDNSVNKKEISNSEITSELIVDKNINPGIVKQKSTNNESSQQIKQEPINNASQEENNKKYNKQEAKSRNFKEKEVETSSGLIDTKTERKEKQSRFDENAYTETNQKKDKPVNNNTYKAPPSELDNYSDKEVNKQIDNSSQSTPAEFDWDNEFKQEDIKGQDSDNSSREMEIDVDKFYDNLDDLMKD